MTVNPTIRTGLPDDLPAIERLLAETGVRCDRALLRDGGDHHVIVLDAPEGGLAAAAVLVIDGNRGHLALLAIDRRYAGAHLEDRVIGVVEALGRAFGAETLDVHSSRAA